MASSSEQLVLRKPEHCDENQAVKLQHLPEDILSHIVGYLGIRSKVRAWETCEELQRAICRGKLVRSINLRCWRVPLSIYDFLSENALYVEELDLSCAKGLSEELAVSALTRLENLRRLDVTHTAMTLRGVNAVCAACPRLVRLACDFACDDPSFLVSKVARESFMNLEYVHFVADSLTTVDPYTVDPFDIMALCRNLKEFKWTILKLSDTHQTLFQCLSRGASNHPTLLSLSCHYMGMCSDFLMPRDYFPQNDWQFLIARNFAKISQQRHRSQLYLSRELNQAARTMGRGGPLESMFVLYESRMNQGFQVDSKCMIDVYVWNSNLTELNPNLYIDVMWELHSKFPKEVCMKTFSPSSTSKDSYILKKCVLEELYGDSEERKLDLNLIEFLPVDRKLKVSFDFAHEFDRCSEDFSQETQTRERGHCNSILSVNFPILSNIVHLSLCEEDLDPALFAVLFRQCSNLETLNFRVSNVSILETIQISGSIRSIRVMSEILEFGGLMSVFRALSACSTLENVHIYDLRLLSSSNEGNMQFHPEGEVIDGFLHGCPNLFNLHIHAYMQPEVEANFRQIIQNKKRGSDFLLTMTDANHKSSNEFRVMSMYLPSRILYEHANLSDLEINRRLTYL